jgi:geranylgeranyl diphosphate synthase, type II
MNFPPYFNDKKQLLDDFISEMLVDSDSDIPKLIEAARYSSLSGGKRIRGVFTLAVAEIVDPKKDVRALAAGIEMIHTYSLIHDDLPAMDDDDFRRGKPSCHKAYGEGLAILTGDFLQTLAYQLFSSELAKYGFDAKNQIETIGFISEKIGLNGMVGGQVIDVASTNQKISKELLEKMHLLKTGAFLEASIVAPVLLLGHDPNDFFSLPLLDYTHFLGLLFQVVDDILDEVGNSEKMGKPIGSDSGQGKSTYISLLGLKQTQAYANEIYEKILSLLKKCDNEDVRHRLTEFAEVIYKRDY